MAAADTALAEQFGVAVSVIEAIRVNQLVAGSEWGRNGNKVHFLPEGITRVASILGIEKKAQPEVVLLQVVGVLPNVRFVRVKTPEGVAEIRVRDNRRLRVRHLLRCRQEAGQWICVQPGIAPL